MPRVSQICFIWKHQQLKNENPQWFQENHWKSREWSTLDCLSTILALLVGSWVFLSFIKTFLHAQSEPDLLHLKAPAAQIWKSPMISRKSFKIERIAHSRPSLHYSSTTGGFLSVFEFHKNIFVCSEWARFASSGSTSSCSKSKIPNDFKKTIGNRKNGQL